jgi:hypothetical protein
LGKSRGGLAPGYFLAWKPQILYRGFTPLFLLSFKATYFERIAWGSRTAEKPANLSSLDGCTSTEVNACASPSPTERF